MMKAVFLVLALASVSYAQKISLGACPAVTAEPAFDVASYLGTWYQIQNYYSLFQSGTCATAEYSLATDGSTVNVINSQILFGVLYNSVEGTAVVSSDDGSGELTVTLAVLGPFFSATSPLLVLDTDYTSYAVVYSCVEVGPLRGENAWILSRTRVMTDAAIAAVNTYIASNPDIIVADSLIVTDQTDCE